MHKYSERDQEVLKLFQQLATGPYNPASYTSVREFVDSFPKNAKPEFVLDPLPPQTYTDTYRKTILSTL